MPEPSVVRMRCLTRFRVFRIAPALLCFALLGGCRSDTPLTEGKETAAIRDATYGALLPKLSNARVHCVALIPFDAQGKPAPPGQDADSLLLTLLRKRRSDVRGASDCEVVADRG